MKKANNKQLPFYLFLLLTFVTACSNLDTRKSNTAAVTPKMDSLVSTQWLSDHLNDDDLVVLDSTVIVKMDQTGMSNISGKAGFDVGHIPNAGFADLKGNLSALNASTDLLMPPPEQFAKAIGELGIDNNSRVVIYSAENHVWAARLWWMLRWAGLEQVAILDGGLAAWKAENRPLSTEPSNRVTKQFKLVLRPEILSNRDEVFNAISDDQVNIVDALPLAHYQGKFTLYSRAGHIPSASTMPTSDLINESGRYKSFDELDMMQDIDRSKRVITYCGGGVAASAAAFTLYRLGFKDVAVYMGSLKEWIADPKNPLVTEN